MSTAFKKRIPNTSEQAFIDVARRIIAGQAADSQALKGEWREIATELFSAFQEDGANGFWTVFDAVARAHPQLDDWRELVKVSPEQAEEQAEQDKYLQFMEFKDLKKLDPPEWLVYRFLPTKGVNFIYGPAGEGKTYLAVGLASAIASEEIHEWLGLSLRHGHCIYIAAEDIDEVAQRFIGYANYHQLEDIPNLHIFPASLQLASDTPRLIESIQHHYQGMKIAAVFIDTLAMCSLGIEENSKKEFDAVTRALESIWRAFDCCVIAIHHSGRNGEFRGTSSMDGVGYTMIKCSKSDERVQLHSTKSRRGKGFDDFFLDWVTVDIPGEIDEAGEQITTGVLVRSASGDAGPGVRLTKLQSNILQHTLNLGSDDVPRREVMSACLIDRNHEQTFVNATSTLLHKGLLAMRLEKRRTYYTLTPSGKELLQDATL